MSAASAERIQIPEFSPNGEPNRDWIRHPRSFVDELIAKGKLAPGIECWILLVIERHTWGADTKDKPAYLEVSQTALAKLCHVSDSAVAEPLKRLEAAGIIDGIPKGELKPGQKRGFRLTPERWHKVKPYCALDAVREKPKDSPPPVGFDADQQDALVLLPGKNKVVPLRIALKGKPEFDLPIR